MQNITHDMRRSSCLLVYTRRNGNSVFAGAAERADRAGAVEDASEKEARSVKAAVAAVAQTMPAKAAAKDKEQLTSGDGMSDLARGVVPPADWAPVVSAAAVSYTHLTLPTICSV